MNKKIIYPNQFETISDIIRHKLMLNERKLSDAIYCKKYEKWIPIGHCEKKCNYDCPKILLSKISENYFKK